MLDSGTDGSWSSKIYPGKIDKYFPRQNIATPAGHFLNCLVFDFEAFEPWSQAYAPGIGMVEWFGMSTWKLRKALVGGKKIGLWP
jgi:hypothetical protein